VVVKLLKHAAPRAVPACPPDLRILHDAVAGEPSRQGAERFDRSVRLVLATDFKHVFANPCKIGGRFFTLLAKRNELDHPRLGLAISRKHVKTAVGRNRIKRQARESFRLLQDRIGNFDVVVMAKPGVDKIDRRQLRAQLDKHWQELAEQCKKS
jgi:ribonuclease P protein component